MSAPDLLERVRMCLAEVGERTDGVKRMPSGATEVGETVDYRTAWMAWSLALLPEAKRVPICLACSVPRSAALAAGDRAESRRLREACLATRPCMEDCGRDRSES